VSERMVNEVVERLVPASVPDRALSPSVLSLRGLDGLNFLMATIGFSISFVPHRRSPWLFTGVHHPRKRRHFRPGGVHAVHA